MERSTNPCSWCRASQLNVVRRLRTARAWEVLTSQAPGARPFARLRSSSVGPSWGGGLSGSSGDGAGGRGRVAGPAGSRLHTRLLSRGTQPTGLAGEPTAQPRGHTSQARCDVASGCHASLVAETIAIPALPHSTDRYAAGFQQDFRAAAGHGASCLGAAGALPGQRGSPRGVILHKG